MASTSQCLASMARLSLSTASRPMNTTIPRFLLPSIAQQTRQAHHPKAGTAKIQRLERKRKAHKTYRTNRLEKMEQFSLCDAIRYARACEVGQVPTSVKYDLSLKLKTPKNGQAIKGRIRLPHPVKTDVRIGVICPENSVVAIQARQAGAVAVGEETLFEQIREGNIKFTALLCHTSSADKLQKANLGRLLGPKGLMPNLRGKTITTNVLSMMKDLVGADNYREKMGVVRIAIGQLGFSPEMVADNVKAFVGKVNADIAEVEEQTPKSIHEVVLSSTHGPGFSLNGGFNPTDEKISTAMLAGPM